MLNKTLENYLRDYQKEVIQKVFSNRFTIVNKSRQIGLSEVAVISAVIAAISGDYRDIYLTSVSHRDAKELLERAVKWVKIFSRVKPELRDANIQKEKISFTNNSRIIAIPAKGIRGRSAYLIILDEFAFQPNSKELWAAISPAVESNPTMKILALSTPLGTVGSMFYDIWSNSSGFYDKWIRQEIDVYTAAAQGFPVDPEELKKRYPKDIFQQEFECKFLGDQSQYFGNQLLLNSQYDDIPGWKSKNKDKEKYNLFAGIDLASRNDASVISTVLVSGDYRYILDPYIVKPAGVEMDYSEQYEKITRYLERRDYTGYCVDGCGEGKAISQDLQNLYKEENVKVYNSGHWRDTQSDIYEMKFQLEEKKLRIPDDRATFNAFASIERKDSNAKVKFKAKSTKTGHADIFFASLMAFDISMNGTEGSSDFVFIP